MEKLLSLLRKTIVVLSHPGLAFKNLFGLSLSVLPAAAAPRRQVSPYKKFAGSRRTSRGERRLKRIWGLRTHGQPQILCSASSIHERF